MKHRPFRIVALLPVVFSLSTSLVRAQLCQTQALTEPVPAANAHLGFSVDLVGARLAVGAPYATAGIHSAGEVHVFGLGPGGWQHEAELTPPTSAANLAFGLALALGGDYLHVGGNPGLNRVESYRLVAGTWMHQGQLTQSGDGFTNFGYALAADGEWLAVAKPGAAGVAGPPGYRPGGVVIYRTNGGLPLQTAVLQPPGLLTGDEFGIDVALRGDVLVVGTRPNVVSNARALVYRRVGTEFLAEDVLLPQGTSSGADSFGATFGLDVATDGVRIAVADPFEVVGPGLTGSVCIWRHEAGTWALEQRIPASSGFNQFGQRIALDGDNLLVGTMPGLRIVHYRRVQGVWTQQAITPSAFSGSFALSSLAIDASRAVVGSILNPGPLFKAGQVLAWTLGSGLVHYGVPLAGAGGFAPQLSGSQCPLVGQPFALELTQGLGGAPGVLAIGAGSTPVGLFGGTVQVNPIVSTTPIVLGGAPGAPGAGTLSLPFGALSPAMLGLRVYFQAALFDTAAPQWLSLTNGLEVVVGA